MREVLTVEGVPPRERLDRWHEIVRTVVLAMSDRNADRRIIVGLQVTVGLLITVGLQVSGSTCRRSERRLTR